MQANEEQKIGRWNVEEGGKWREKRRKLIPKRIKKERKKTSGSKFVVDLLAAVSTSFVQSSSTLLVAKETHFFPFSISQLKKKVNSANRVHFAQKPNIICMFR